MDVDPVEVREQVVELARELADAVLAAPDSPIKTALKHLGEAIVALAEELEAREEADGA